MKIKYCIYSLLVGSVFCINVCINCMNQNWNSSPYGLSGQYIGSDQKKDPEENIAEIYSPEFKLSNSLSSSDIVLSEGLEISKKNRQSSKSGLQDSEIKDNYDSYDDYDNSKEIKIYTGALGGVLEFLSMVNPNKKTSQDNLVKQEVQEIQDDNNNQSLEPFYAPSTRVNHESVQNKIVQKEFENMFSLDENNRREIIENQFYNLPERPLFINRNNRNNFNNKESELLLKSSPNHAPENSGNHASAQRASQNRVRRSSPVDYSEYAKDNPLKASRVKKSNNNAKLALLGITAIAGIYKFRHKIKDIYASLYNKFFSKKSVSKLDLVKQFEKTLTKEQWEEYSVFSALNKAYAGDYSAFNSFNNSSDFLDTLTNNQQDLVKKIAS